MKTILVVDDEVDIAEGLRWILEDQGYFVMVARNGIEALEILKDKTPDLILLDMMMPVMNGEELLRALKGRNPHLEVPVVCMSAGNVEAVARKYRLPIVQKPFDLDFLLNLIRDLARKD